MKGTRMDYPSLCVVVLRLPLPPGPPTHLSQPTCPPARVSEKLLRTPLPLSNQHNDDDKDSLLINDNDDNDNDKYDKNDNHHANGDDVQSSK